MRTIISGAQIIDGTGRPPLPRGCVIVEDGRIVGLEARDRVNATTSDERVDLPGCTILPGLIDAHSHLASDPGLGNQAQQLSLPEAELAMRSVRYLRKDLLAGVTTVRLMSEKHFIDVIARRLVEQDVLPGPRMVIATRGLRPSNGHGSSPVVVDGPENIRRIVRENLKAGADLIKLFLTGGLSSDGSGVLQCGYTIEEVKAAVEEAHAAQRPVAVHAHGGPAIDISLAAGVDSIEHGTMLTPAQIDQIVAKGVWVVLTMTLFLDDHGLMQVDGANPRIRERILRARDAIADTVRYLISAGARVAVGSDALHGRLSHELEYLALFGMSPLEAIKSCTRNGAEICGVLDQTGTLEVGKQADLIAVEGDPLVAMSCLRNVRLILKGQRRYDGLSRD